MRIGIGETLREARNRRKVGLADVETATKIRVRYLQAMENEDWEVLPGAAYTPGFIRTYASYLGLDGERLADDYRKSAEAPSAPRPPRVEPAATGRTGGGRARWAPGWVFVAALVAGLFALALAIGILGDGEEGVAPGTGSTRTGIPGREAEPEPIRRGPRTPGVAVQLTAQAEVWVCLVDADGTELIDGAVLDEGEEEGPFRSTEFSVSFGNGEVSLLVDGAEAEIPVTSSPLGYRINSDGELSQLAGTARPTCT